jgi:LysR family transcriptional regulator, low CO2-responsive transcriptional regulator
MLQRVNNQIARRASLRQLQVFEAIARLGSFTRAADELYLTQPTVSMQIKKLEESIGSPLFEQVGKKIYLTQVGDLLLQTATDVLRSMANFDMAVADHKGLKTGSLRLAVVTTAKYFAPRVLGRFCARYPGVDVALKVTNRESLIGRMARNIDDLYIMGRPPHSAEYEFQSLMENPIIVVAPANHSLAREKNIPLQRITEEPFIMREDGSGTRMAVESLFSEHQLKLKVRMELGSNEVIKHAVASGLGISALSENTIDFNKENELAKLDVQFFPIPKMWYIGFPAGKRLSVIAQTFLAFMKKDVSGISSLPAPDKQPD